uniref:Uncharacterized protein n=2 Tax=Gopherus TaxID=38771 RepID=A0A8C4YQ44_9SAUR
MVHIAHLFMKNDHGGHVALWLAFGGCATNPTVQVFRTGGLLAPLPTSRNEKLVGLNSKRIKHWIGWSTACGALREKPGYGLWGRGQLLSTSTMGGWSG